VLKDPEGGWQQVIFVGGDWSEDHHDIAILDEGAPRHEREMGIDQQIIRARPNTLRAIAHDLKAFFSVVDKDPCGGRAGRVQVPGASARRPHGDPDQRWRGGTVGAHDRPPARCT
jgi:hypothetical protein